MAKEPYKDPFPNLPRRFGTFRVVDARHEKRPPPKSSQTAELAVDTKAARIDAARAALKDAGARSPKPPKPKTKKRKAPARKRKATKK